MSENNEKCPEMVPRCQDIQFAIIVNRQKEQMFTSKRLEPVNVFKNDLHD